MKRKDIFISYRREGGLQAAQMLADKLSNDGYSVFIDLESLHNGSFDTGIYQSIDGCTDFIIILSPESFDRMTDPQTDLSTDWMYLELSHALQQHKNIVPVALPGFKYPQSLPKEIQEIKSIEYVEQNIYYDAFYKRLKKNFLESHPIKHYLKWGAVGVLFAAILIIGACFWGQKNKAMNWSGTWSATTVAGDKKQGTQEVRYSFVINLVPNDSDLNYSGTLEVSGPFLHAKGNIIGEPTDDNSSITITHLKPISGNGITQTFPDNVIILHLVNTNHNVTASWEDEAQYLANKKNVTVFDHTSE